MNLTAYSRIYVLFPNAAGDIDFSCESSSLLQLIIKFRSLNIVSIYSRNLRSGNLNLSGELIWLVPRYTQR